MDVFGKGTTTEEGTGDTTTEEGGETEGKDGKKKKKMTMGEYLRLILFCQRPDGTIDFNSFYAKYCDDDEKPVKVTPLEPQTFGNYEEG